MTTDWLLLLLLLLVVSSQSVDGQSTTLTDDETCSEGVMRQSDITRLLHNQQQIMRRLGMSHFE